MKMNIILNLALASGTGLNEIIKMLVEDPRSVDMLTTSEKTTLILFVAGLGMAITFLVLVFLWFSIAIFSKILASTNKEETKEVQEVLNVMPEKVEEDNDEELVAVIAAAIACSLNKKTNEIIVKNIVRVPNTSPKWGEIGRIEQINTRF